MRFAARFGGLCLAGSLLIAPTTAPAAHAPKPITGKLTKSGYTVIALAASGRAASVRAMTGDFKVVARAGTVTLHLRDPKGKYAGPIVVGGSGKRVIVGVKARTSLGLVRIRDGYARVARRLPKRSLDATRWARAKHGVPLGARVFGRVRSKPPRVSVPGDRDLDGIPDAFDIDDDGDLTLDNLDRSTAARAAQGQGESFFGSHFDLGMELDQTANANAGSTDQLIEAALPSFGRLDLQILPGDSAELDCGQAQSRTDPRLGGLGYCTRGGTGTAFKPGVPGPGAPFPDCCDPDGDGFGTLTETPNVPEPAMFLRPGATASQIGTGDVLIERVTTGGVETQFPTALQYVFATVPALVSYNDGQGFSTTLAYPVAGPDPGTGHGGGPGTRENGFPVKAGPNGDVVVTLTFWRPQRRPIPGEPGYGQPGAWTDMGGLNYTAGVADVDLRCPQSAFAETDPSLTVPAPETLEAGGFRDLAPDRPSSPANTFTYTLNLTACLRSPVSGHGPAPGLSFNPGQTRGFKLSGLSLNEATGGGESAEAEQSIFFTRQ